MVTTFHSTQTLLHTHPPVFASISGKRYNNGNLMWFRITHYSETEYSNNLRSCRRNLKHTLLERVLPSDIILSEESSKERKGNFVSLRRFFLSLFFPAFFNPF